MSNNIDPRNLLDSAISSEANANTNTNTYYDVSNCPTSFRESLLSTSNSNPINFSGISDLVYDLNRLDPNNILSFLET